MAQQKSKEQLQQKLLAIAKEYQTNLKFKQLIDLAYETARQQSPEQITLLENQYKENSKIVFAYMMLEQQEEQLKNKTYASASGLPRYSKLGSKLDYIGMLNGRCPEGYEVEKYLAGGCVKCKKQSVVNDLIANLRSTMKQRFGKVDQAKCGKKMKAKKC